MYKVNMVEDYGPLDEVVVERDPIRSLSELAANEVRRMPVYPDDLPSKVDIVGYVDPNKRIKQMVEAGIRIDAWNHAVYDFENGEEDDDGLSMPVERSDLDELDGLAAGVTARARYFDEMYRLYRKALEAESGVGDKGVSGDSGTNSDIGETDLKRAADQVD